MPKFDWEQSLFGGIATGVFGGKKKKPKKRSTFDKDQQALYGDYVNSIRGQGPFADMYNYDAEGANANFDKNVGRPAYRNFQENIIPGITGQFRSKGLMNSSYTGEALGRAGRDVQENLDAKRSDMQFQGQQAANQNKMQGIQNILGMTTFDYEQPGESSLDKILKVAGPAAANYASAHFGGARTSGNF